MKNDNRDIILTTQISKCILVDESIRPRIELKLLKCLVIEPGIFGQHESNCPQLLLFECDLSFTEPRKASNFAVPVCV